MLVHSRSLTANRDYPNRQVIYFCFSKIPDLENVKTDTTINSASWVQVLLWMDKLKKVWSQISRSSVKVTWFILTFLNSKTSPILKTTPTLVHNHSALTSLMSALLNKHIIFYNFYLIKLHETCRASHNNSEQKNCFRIYFTDYAKICINQKGFGQGMGATNAQNRVKRI